MSRFKQLIPPLLFAIFVASAIATMSATRAQLTALTVLCGAAWCGSFVALAAWVYVHSRPPSTPDEPQPVTAAPSDLVLASRHLVRSVRALLSRFPPGRAHRRWEAFERDFWSHVERSPDVPRRSRGSRPPD